jgi:hypothetical protein
VVELLCLLTLLRSLQAFVLAVYKGHEVIELYGFSQCSLDTEVTMGVAVKTQGCVGVIGFGFHVPQPLPIRFTQENVVCCMNKSRMKHVQ